jgi:hypothetical protein
MKKILFWGWLVVFLPAMASAQEKMEAPTWNVGDRWAFTRDGSIEVIKVDPNGYILKFSDKVCFFESQGYSAILFDKSTRNRMNAIEGDKRKKYVMGLSKVLDFPLSGGKQWMSAYSTTVITDIGFRQSRDYSENFRVLGWDDVKVRAGQFKALRVEYRRTAVGSSSAFGTHAAEEIINHYWYSPDVKYFVKCEYDKDWMGGEKEIFNWELTSFQSKK